MSIGYLRVAQAVAAALAATSFYSVAAIAEEATASGEVRRVNVVEGKITIKHGAIADAAYLERIAKALPDVIRDAASAEAEAVRPLPAPAAATRTAPPHPLSDRLPNA